MGGGGWARPAPGGGPGPGRGPGRRRGAPGVGQARPARATVTQKEESGEPGPVQGTVDAVAWDAPCVTCWQGPVDRVRPVVDRSLVVKVIREPFQWHNTRARPFPCPLPGVDIILGWDWIVLRDLRKLSALGEMVAEGPNGTVRVPMARERRAMPGGGRASAHWQAVGGQSGGNRLVGHGAFERLIEQPYAEV